MAKIIFGSNYDAYSYAEDVYQKRKGKGRYPRVKRLFGTYYKSIFTVVTKK